MPGRRQMETICTIVGRKLTGLFDRIWHFPAPGQHFSPFYQRDRENAPFLIVRDLATWFCFARLIAAIIRIPDGGWLSFLAHDPVQGSGDPERESEHEAQKPIEEFIDRDAVCNRLYHDQLHLYRLPAIPVSPKCGPGH